MNAPAIIEPLAVDLKTAAATSTLSVRTLTRAIKIGELPASKIGTRVIIQVTDLKRWIDDHRCSAATPKSVVPKVVKEKSAVTG